MSYRPYGGRKSYDSAYANPAFRIWRNHHQDVSFERWTELRKSGDGIRHLAEDFPQHPLTPSTVLLATRRLRTEEAILAKVHETVRRLGLVKINHAWRYDGLAITFRTEHEAILFKLASADW